MRRVAWISLVVVVLALPMAAPATAADPVISVQSTEVRIESSAGTYEGANYDCLDATTTQTNIPAEDHASCSSSGVPEGENPVGTSSTEYTLDQLSTGGSLTRIRWNATAASDASWGQNTAASGSTLTTLSMVVNVANGPVPLSVDATLNAVTNAIPDFDGGTAAYITVNDGLGGNEWVWRAGDDDPDDLVVDQDLDLATGQYGISLTTITSASGAWSTGAPITGDAASDVLLWFGERNEVSIGDLVGNEGHSGTTPFTFEVMRPGGPAGTVDYEVVGVNATPGADYVAAEGVVPFEAGEEYKTVTVDVVGDRLREPVERFRVLLSEVDLAVLDRIGIGRINNDDACDNLFTAGADTIIGTSGDNVLCGGGGVDRIEGRGGNDVLLGGADIDTLLGGDGRDTLQGGDGNDVLRGGVGADTVAGGAGDDKGYGDDGADSLDGEGGLDRLFGGAAGDTFRDCDGPVDRLNGDAGIDSAAAHPNAVLTSIESVTGC